MITIPNYGESFLSKVLDEGTTRAIREFSIEPTDYPTKVEQQAHEFIMDYAKDNGGRTPDYRTVIEKIPDFYYREGVIDSYRSLTKEIKSYAAKKQVADMFEGVNGPSVQTLLNTKDGNIVIDDLISGLEKIRIGTSVRDKVGTDIKRDTKKIRDEYERRKAGESYTVWRSFLSIINDAAGGYVSSNVYTVYGESGRGKSAITLEEAIFLADQGANVLIWAMEMGWYELFVRIFTSYSRRKGNVAMANIQGVNMDIGFNSGELRNGKLPEDFENKFFDFLEQINDLLPGNIIVRGVDDEDFSDRSLKQLESDIIQTNADVVVLDPFYYLDYEANTSKTKGGDAANTSQKLRRLAGTTKTVIFAITQADETDTTEDDEGNRELNLPGRPAVKKTKQLLEDAAVLIAVDTNYQDGRGLVGINKGRNGGEGEVAEIIYLPQYGIIEELRIDEALAMDLIKDF